MKQPCFNVKLACSEAYLNIKMKTRKVNQPLPFLSKTVNQTH